MSSQPLVSIVVITYNSGATVLETLESIGRQSYGNIELIVADDASRDDTVDKVRRWMDAHAPEFSAAELVASAVNGGIPANFNRGLARSRGEYVKIIAGDDLLTADCIEFDVARIGDGVLLCTAMYGKRGEVVSSLHSSDIRNTEAFFSSPHDQQFRSYVRNPIFLNTPTFFFRKSLFDAVGNFDERIRLLEDQPFVCKVLARGYHIDYANHVTVIYRISEGSAMGGQSRAFLRCLSQTYRLYRRPHLRWYSFPELLLILEGALLRLLLTRALYHPTLITWFKKCSPSRIFLEPGFTTHFLSLSFGRKLKLKT